jgi:hypothetical protein
LIGSAITSAAAFPAGLKNPGDGILTCIDSGLPDNEKLKVPFTPGDDILEDRILVLPIEKILGRDRVSVSVDF